MSCTNPESEYEALVFVVQRMELRYPTVDADTLFALVAEEVAEFDGVTVRTYVPVLVERRVRDRLDRELALAA